VDPHEGGRSEPESLSSRVQCHQPHLLPAVGVEVDVEGKLLIPSDE
jgi:hypothetical protein